MTEGKNHIRISQEAALAEFFARGGVVQMLECEIDRKEREKAEKFIREANRVEKAAKKAAKQAAKQMSMA